MERDRDRGRHPAARARAGDRERGRLGHLSPASGAGGRLVVNVDGGARGNPGPAAIAAVVSTPEGEVVEEHGERIGTATNNVAEYRALLLGLDRARARGAREVELVGDSELVVRQVRGEYKVKDDALK